MKLVKLDPDQVCACGKPRPSGTFHLGWEKCLTCSGFIVPERGERERLARSRDRGSSSADLLGR